MTGHPFDAIADGIDALPAMVPGVCMPAGPQVDQLASWLRWTPCRDVVVESAVPSSLAAASPSGELAAVRKAADVLDNADLDETISKYTADIAVVTAYVESVAPRVESATERVCPAHPGSRRWCVDGRHEIDPPPAWASTPSPPVAAMRDQTAGAPGQGGAGEATATLTDVEATLAMLDNVIWSNCEPSSFVISDGDRHVSYDRDNFARLLLGMPLRSVVRRTDVPFGEVGERWASGTSYVAGWYSDAPWRSSARPYNPADLLPARVLDLPADQAPATDGGAS